MKEDKIAIFIPTLYRPDKLKRTIKSIQDTSDVHTYVMFPRDDINTQEVIEHFNNVEYFTDSDPENMRFVRRIQYLYSVTDDDWFLTGADDVVFRDGWLQAAEPYMNDYSVISFDDMCNPNVPGTNFLIKRQYIDEQSGVVDSPKTVLHQGYYHNFCDNELIGTAKARNTFIKCDGKIEHFHHTVGKSENDIIYSMAQAKFHDDAALCHSREHLWS